MNKSVDQISIEVERAPSSHGALLEESGRADLGVGPLSLSAAGKIKNSGRDTSSNDKWVKMKGVQQVVFTWVLAGSISWSTGRWVFLLLIYLLGSIMKREALSTGVYF